MDVRRDVFLRVEGLGLSFSGRVVLEDFSLEMYEKETIALVGPSGCGKTTLFNIMAGILPPQRGHISIKSSESGEYTRASATQKLSAYMFQDHTLLPWRTLLNNVMLPAEVDHAADLIESKKRATELLESFGLLPSASYYPDQLSGGMRQRAAFARTFMADRRLYLFDEPFSSLDYLRQLQIERILCGFLAKKRRNCIIITHDIEAAIALCHRVIILGGPPLKIRKVLRTGLDDEWDDPVEARKTELFSSCHRAIVAELQTILEHYVP